MAMASPLEQLFTFLRFASISTDRRHKADVRACAEFLRGKLDAIGLTSELHETDGHPVVLARNAHREGRPTVLIYGHYDVQPVDPVELWDSNPFEPEVKDGKIYARGATDNKGQMFAHVLGVEAAMRAEGELPVNLIFLFEGEEEIGSPHLEPFLRAHRTELACDIIAVSDTSMVAPGVPTMGYGLRGITCGEITLRGPESDLHSGVYGGAVLNPVTALARMVASLHNESGRVQVEGFYDDVQPIADWEKEAWAKVPGGDEAFLEEVRVPELFGEQGYSTHERLWARPTAEVNGLYGGYQGEGSKTIVPARATAKLSFRLVPNQDPEDIQAKVERHFRNICPSSVAMEWTPGHSGRPYLADPQSPFGKAAQSALQDTFNREPVLVREGGSIPIINTFQEVLGAQTLMLGLALPGCRIHSPNENFTIENFEAGIRLNQRLLARLGEVSGEA